MHWNSAAEFFAMGGYALYVWLSFGACLLLMVLEPWLVKRRLREAVRNAQQLHRMRHLDEQHS